MDKLGLHARDWIWIGTLIVGLVANYAAISTRIAEVERRVVVIDARLWELQGQSAFSGRPPRTRRTRADSVAPSRVQRAGLFPQAFLNDHARYTVPIPPEER